MCIVLAQKNKKDLHVYVSHTLDAWFRYLLTTGSDNAGRVVGVTYFNWMRSLHAKFDEYQSVLMTLRRRTWYWNLYFCDRTDISPWCTWGAASAT